MMKGTMVRLLVGCLAVMILAGSAEAAYVYDFTGTYRDFNTNELKDAAFTLSLGSALAGTGAVGFTPDMSFLPGPELVCAGCSKVEYFYDAVAHGFTGTPSDVIGWGDGGATYFFYFAVGAVTTPGVHDSIILDGLHDGTLKVSVRQVPEPPTMLLLLSALTALGRSIRNRF